MIQSYVIILYGIVLATITFFVIWYIIKRPRSSIKDYIKKPVSVSQVTPILSSDETNTLLVSTPGCTTMGLFNIQNGDRTPHLKDTYYPLFGIPGIWSFELAPTKLNIGNTTAQLRIMTATPTGPIEEIINLPDLPLQKWIFISVLRDGRRFDIMYNDSVVASHRLTHYPAIVPSSFQVGNSNIVGSVIHIMLSPERIIPTEIITIWSGLVDTNGAPMQSILSALFPGKSDIDISMPAITTPVSAPPSNTMKAWLSPYA